MKPSALLVVMLLAMSACGRVSDALAAPTTTAQPAAAAATAPDPEQPADFSTYEAAVGALVACMDDAGATISSPVLDASTGLFVYDYDESSEAIHNDCYAQTIADIDASYRLDPTGPVDVATGPARDWSATAPDSWVSVLSKIPATTDTRYSPVTIIDLRRAQGTFEITSPDEAANDAEVIDYLGAMAASAGIVPTGPLGAFGRSALPSDMRRELGFDHRNIDRVASAGHGAKEIVVADGMFDAATIDAAVSSDPSWSPVLQTTDIGDTTVHRWGIDFELDLDRFTATRPVGHNRRLGVGTDGIFWLRWDDGVRLTAATATGTQRSLADHDELRSLAVVADQLGLYSAVLTASVAPLVGDLDRQRIDAYTLARPQSVLIGDGADDEGRYVAIVLDYGSPAAATTHAADFTGRLDELASVAVESELLVRLEEPRLIDVTRTANLLVGRIWLVDDAPLPDSLDLLTFR